MVFVSVFLVVVLLGTLFLYQAGKLTSEKMRLQNAADAVAFSLSNMEARDLNFMSYLNRAMVANEVGIAQMVGLVSWAEHVRSVGDFLRLYDRLCCAGPTLGISTAIIEPIAAGFNTVGSTMLNVLRPVARIAITTLHKINGLAYGNAQKFYHYATLLFMFSAIEPLLERNAPGAKLSDFGWLAFIGHVVTYADFGVSALSPFTTSFNPRKRAHVEGYKRFATITRASRDKFSRQRGWTYGLQIIPRVCIPLWPVRGCIRMSIGMTRNGGTELRFVGAPRSAIGRRYNWSAADLVAAFAELWVRIQVNTIFAGWKTVLNRTIKADIPFSAGAAQAGRRIILSRDMLPGTKLPSGAYGHAPDYPISWLPVAAKIALPHLNVGRKYNGLPPYSDTTRGPEWGFAAPYLLVGVVKDVNDARGRRRDVVNRPGGPRAVGRLQLLDPTRANEGADNELAVVAKSEVYFKRPTDLSFFRRADGKTEHGSAFNPYWQARLVDTDYADRVVSLLLQQKQVWIPSLSQVTLPSPSP